MRKLHEFRNWGYVSYVVIYVTQIIITYLLALSRSCVKCFSLFSNSSVMFYGFSLCFPIFSLWLWNWLWAQLWIMTILYRPPVNFFAQTFNQFWLFKAQNHMQWQQLYREILQALTSSNEVADTKRHRCCLYLKTGMYLLTQTTEHLNLTLSSLNPITSFLPHK